jgi:uncharacterized OB-fold protein
MTVPQRRIISPEPNPETQAFWDAATEKRFTLRRCLDCHRVHWYPRAVCPHCFSAHMQVESASGNGTIYSYSVMRRVPVPYAIAYVTLAEGPTMLTNITGCDLDTLRIGQPVRLMFVASENGTPVPMFTPA